MANAERALARSAVGLQGLHVPASTAAFPLQGEGGSIFPPGLHQTRTMKTKIQGLEEFQTMGRADVASQPTSVGSIFLTPQARRMFGLRCHGLRNACAVRKERAQWQRGV